MKPTMLAKDGTSGDGAEVEQDREMILKATRWSSSALAAAIPYREYMDAHTHLAQRAS